MTNKVKIALAVAIVIAIAGGYLFPKIHQIEQVAQDSHSEQSHTDLGAVPTLDGVDSGFAKINGQRTFTWARPMTATSSVICAFKNPYNATSSISALSAESRSNGIGVAHNLYISTSTSAFGSSTPALVSAFPMGTGQWSIEFAKNSATSTNSTAGGGGLGDTTLLPGRDQTGASLYVLGPSEWITWRIASTTAGTFAAYNAGECSAIVKKI